MARNSAPIFYAAGFWRRLAGAILDILIVLPVCIILAYGAGRLAGISLPDTRRNGIDFWLDLALGHNPALFGALGLTISIGIIYLLLFQITQARTLGMRALKMRIIDIYGDRPSAARAFARTFGYLIGLATLSLGFLWIGFDSERRGLHDWLSGTHVIKS